jgi:hypothetical protein
MLVKIPDSRIYKAVEIEIPNLDNTKLHELIISESESFGNDPHGGIYEKLIR